MEAPRIYPTTRYRDAEAAIRWLCDAFGFTERAVYRHDGVVVHAELAFGASIVMLGQARDDAFGKLIGDQTHPRTDAVYVAVDDPDGLCARVRAAGGTIVMEPVTTDYGSRDFSCRDPEGHLWSFGSYWPKADEPPLPPGEGQTA
jgi:uncharacterized glyoxalase superfamily protein PhnB